MQHILVIGAGGAIGAILRYVVGQSVQTWTGRGFPWGTLSVNVLGSLLIGVLTVLLLEKWSDNPELRAFLLIGILGAFTTFSTFSMETVNLLMAQQFAKAMINVLASVSVCVMATWLGLYVTRQLV